MTIRRMVRGVVVGLMLVVAAGCVDDSLTGSSNVTGEYTLRTVNGSPIPYTVPGTGPNTTEIVSGTIVLYQTSTFARDGHSRTTVNGQGVDEHTSETGTWSIGGSRVSLRSATGTVTDAVITGSDMTIVNPGMTLVFRK